MSISAHFDELDYDVDAHSVAPAYDFVTAVFPDRTVKRTLQEATRCLRFFMCTSVSKYGTTHVVNPLWDEYIGELKPVRVI